MSALTNYIVKRPLLKRWLTPIANWYTDAAGYRKLGLRYDFALLSIQLIRSMKAKG